MKFNHFIITRFNLPIYSELREGTVTSTDETYLDNRFYLFEKFCLPSIEQQTCQDFKWLVLFDINTPYIFKKRIENIQNRYNRFIPCFLNLEQYKVIDNTYFDYYYDYISHLNKNEYECIENNINEYNRMIITPMFISDCIHKHSKEQVDFVVTTRIDNDDAFHKNFIEIIQKEVKKQKKFILLDYINGYKYILNKRFVSKMCYPNGHFTTLIEPYKKHLQSALYWTHNVAFKIIPVKHIDCSPMYIELVHDTNVINCEKNLSLSDFTYALKNFKHTDFGYKGIHLSLFMIIKTACIFGFTYLKNYISYHLSHKK